MSTRNFMLVECLLEAQSLPYILPTAYLRIYDTVTSTGFLNIFLYSLLLGFHLSFRHMFCTIYNLKRQCHQIQRQRSHSLINNYFENFLTYRHAVLRNISMYIVLSSLFFFWGRSVLHGRVPLFLVRATATCATF